MSRSMLLHVVLFLPTLMAGALALLWEWTRRSDRPEPGPDTTSRGSLHPAVFCALALAGIAMDVFIHRQGHS